MDFHYEYMDDLFLKEFQNYESIDRTYSEPLAVEEYDQAIILPCDLPAPCKYGGVVDKDGNYVELSAFRALKPIDGWGAAYEFNVPECMDEKVMYFGVFWRQWGHFLMDHVSRLWYCIEREPEIKIAYCASEDTALSGNYLEFLQLLGIQESQLIKITKPTRFKKVIVPECSYNPGIKYHPSFKNLFEIVVTHAIQRASCEIKRKYENQDVYLSRKLLKRRVPIDIGEVRIEKLFVENGFLSISPEILSLTEQIACIRLAKRIACVYGTLSHGMMFAKDGATLINIKKTYKQNYRQSDINMIRQLCVYNIDAHISLKPVGPSGPYLITKNQNVVSFFKEYIGVNVPNTIVDVLIEKMNLVYYKVVYWYRNRHRILTLDVFNGERFSPFDESILKTYYNRKTKENICSNPMKR